MLEPQVVVNLVPEFGISVNLVRRDRCFGEIVDCCAGRFVYLILLVVSFCSETDEFHKTAFRLGLTLKSRPNQKGPYEALRQCTFAPPTLDLGLTYLAGAEDGSA